MIGTPRVAAKLVSQGERIRAVNFEGEDVTLVSATLTQVCGKVGSLWVLRRLDHGNERV